MSFAAVYGAVYAHQSNGSSVTQGNLPSPLDAGWVVVANKEPSFLDVEIRGCERAKSVGSNADQYARSDVSGPPEDCKAVSAVTTGIRDCSPVNTGETAPSDYDDDEQPLNDMPHELRLLLREYANSRKHYQDCHMKTTNSLQSELGKAIQLVQNGHPSDSSLHEGLNQTLMTVTAMNTQCGALRECDLELCELEQRLSDKMSALIGSSTLSRYWADGLVEQSRDADDAEVKISDDALLLLEDYYEKAGDVFVAKERVIKLQEEYEDALGGSKSFPGSKGSTAVATQRIYESRRSALVGQLAAAEKRLMECREACVHQGINPETARYRRISGKRAPG